jgi:hypothetical protein
MRRETLWTLTMAGLLVLTGCNQAKSPDKVRKDVQDASTTAAQNDAKATEKLASADNAADRDMAKAEQKADDKTADAAANAIVTEAEGDRKVAYAKCESLSGDAQRNCRRNADQEYEAVKNKVKSLQTGGSTQ